MSLILGKTVSIYVDHTQKKGTLILHIIYTKSSILILKKQKVKHSQLHILKHPCNYSTNLLPRLIPSL